MELVTWGLATVVGAFVGSFLAGYLRKKGENLATHEDIDKLVQQMAKVTEATKEIEAAISSRVWERQRKWELKRDALFEAIKGLGDVEYGLSKMVLAYMGKGVPPEAENEARDAWDDALLKFKRSRTLAYLVSGSEVRKIFDDVEASFVSVIKGVRARTEIPEWFPAFRKQLNKLLDAVHTELAGQSNESSAVQGPG